MELEEIQRGLQGRRAYRQPVTEYIVMTTDIITSSYDNIGEWEKQDDQ